MEAVVSQCAPQYTLLSTLLYLQVCIAMSHWSGVRFSYTVHTGSSSGLLSSILLLLCVTETLQRWTSPLHALQQFIDGVDDGVSHLKAPDLGLVGS